MGTTTVGRWGASGPQGLQEPGGWTLASPPGMPLFFSFFQTLLSPTGCGWGNGHWKFLEAHFQNFVSQKMEDLPSRVSRSKILRKSNDWFYLGQSLQLERQEVSWGAQTTLLEAQAWCGERNTSQKNEGEWWGTNQNYNVQCNLAMIYGISQVDVLLLKSNEMSSFS